MRLNAIVTTAAFTSWKAEETNLVTAANVFCLMVNVSVCDVIADNCDRYVCSSIAPVLYCVFNLAISRACCLTVADAVDKLFLNACVRVIPLSKSAI